MEKYDDTNIVRDIKQPGASRRLEASELGRNAALWRSLVLAKLPGKPSNYPALAFLAGSKV